MISVTMVACDCCSLLRETRSTARENHDRMTGRLEMSCSCRSLLRINVGSHECLTSSQDFADSDSHAGETVYLGRGKEQYTVHMNYTWTTQYLCMKRAQWTIIFVCFSQLKTKQYNFGLRQCQSFIHHIISRQRCHPFWCYIYIFIHHNR